MAFIYRTIKTTTETVFHTGKRVIETAYDSASTVTRLATDILRSEQFLQTTKLAATNLAVDAFIGSMVGGALSARILDESLLQGFCDGGYIGLIVGLNINLKALSNLLSTYISNQIHHTGIPIPEIPLFYEFIFMATLGDKTYKMLKDFISMINPSIIQTFPVLPSVLVFFVHALLTNQHGRDFIRCFGGDLLLAHGDILRQKFQIVFQQVRTLSMA